MGQNKLYNFGIYVLVFIYILMNINYKKYNNIIIFGGLLAIINLIIKDYTNSIVLAYIISIVFGIYKNFHLIENFKQQSPKEFNISLDSNTVVNKPKVKPPKIIKNSDIKLKNFDIKSLISDELLDKFILNLKKEHISIIYNRKINPEHLKPTLQELNLKKITELKSAYDLGNHLNKPIIVSRDNFIVDGHHRWYSHRAILNDSINTNQLGIKLDNKINTIVINLDINTIIKKIKQFKFQYNKTQVKHHPIDKKRFMAAKKTMNQIKQNVNNLDKYFEDLSNLKLI